MPLLISCLSLLFIRSTFIEAFSFSTWLPSKKLILEPRQGCAFKLQSTMRETEHTVDALLIELQTVERDDMKISRYIRDLETSYIPSDDDSRFESLVGLYEVSYIKTQKMEDNPVGGKWTRPNGLAQKVLKTRRSFQHITPSNSTGRGALVTQDGRAIVAEAINVISLEGLWGLCRCSVILRGDAIALNVTERRSNVSQPLSIVAVRALFDAPRIVFGKSGRWLNINIGPKSSVLLDASYVDDKIRIGVGGTSGTRFVFKRCVQGDEEATEFRELLAMNPLSKRKALLLAVAFTTFGVSGVITRGLRLPGYVIVLLSTVMGSLVAFSSGGIERHGISEINNKNSI